MCSKLLFLGDNILAPCIPTTIFMFSDESNREQRMTKYVMGQFNNVLEKPPTYHGQNYKVENGS